MLDYSWDMEETASHDSLRTIKIILGIMVLVLILFVLKIASSVTVPLAISLFCFLLANPMVDRMEKLHFPRWLSTLIAMVIILVLFLFFGWFLVFTVNTLMKQIPNYVPRVAWIDQWLTQFLSDKLDVDMGGQTLLTFVNINWAKVMMDSLYNLSGKFISIATDAMLIYIFVFFLLLERASLKPKLNVMSNHRGKKVLGMFERINRQISKYLLLKTLISAATGVLFFLASVVTGLDFAILWGVLAFVLNFIPSIGSIIITMMTIIMAVIQFAPNWIMIIYVAVLMISIEMVLGNIIDPRLQGVQLNLSPFIILVSLSLWGYIWGIAGMFLAVPITSVLQIICANVKPLRGIAILLSSGKVYRRQYDQDRAMASARKKMMKREKKRLRHHPGESMTSEQMDDAIRKQMNKKDQGSAPADDFIMPDFMDNHHSDSDDDQ